MERRKRDHKRVPKRRGSRGRRRVLRRGSRDCRQRQRDRDDSDNPAPQTGHPRLARGLEPRPGGGKPSQSDGPGRRRGPQNREAADTSLASAGSRPNRARGARTAITRETHLTPMETSATTRSPSATPLPANSLRRASDGRISRGQTGTARPAALHTCVEFALSFSLLRGNASAASFQGSVAAIPQLQTNVGPEAIEGR